MRAKQIGHVKFIFFKWKILNYSPLPTDEKAHAVLVPKTLHETFPKIVVSTHTIGYEITMVLRWLVH